MLKILIRGTPDGAQLAEILIHQTLAQQPRFIISLDIIFIQPSVSNTEPSDGHSPPKNILLYQGGDCCYGSAKPKCGKGDWTERGDGINQPSSLLNFTIRLVVTKPILALQDSTLLY